MGRGVLAALLLAALLLVAPGWRAAGDPQGSPMLAPIAEAMSDAERSLRAGDRAQAERRYADALSTAWTLVATLEAAAGRQTYAREAQARGAAPLADHTPPSAGHDPDTTRVAGLTATARRDLRAGVAALIAPAYFNLGVLAAQDGKFEHSAAMLEITASEAPNFPMVQRSLGVAYFNARRYQKATEALSGALTADPPNADLRRMLALAWLDVEAYDKAAALLKDDPRRDVDPSLQYAYGMALVRSGRADEAERIFTALLAAHSDSAELNVILGEAQAEQGDFQAGITLLQEALRLNPQVEDANAALGTIYFKQGRFAEADEVLRTELRLHTGADRARQMLATVLDLEGHSDEAVGLLRTVLASRPDSNDARYLLGKILLAQGHAADATEQLSEAVRLAPDDASGHFQLAQAYRRLGQNEHADQQLALYRSLKDTQRGRRP
jgi:Flp pilus assembly protein TadD